MSREIANAVVGSGLCASWTSSASSPDVGDLDDLHAAGRGVADQALGRRSAPNRIGSPWTSGMIASALVSGSLIASNAPSLKIGQFW